MYDEYEIHEFDYCEFKDGRDFERYCAALLEKNQYTDVKLTNYTDHGVDILARKDGKLYAFQCKLRKDTAKISRDAIEQIYTGKTLYKADVGVLMTNVELTKGASLDAVRLGIKVWGSYHLGLLSDTV